MLNSFSVISPRTSMLGSKIAVLPARYAGVPADIEEYFMCRLSQLPVMMATYGRNTLSRMFGVLTMPKWLR